MAEKKFGGNISGAASYAVNAGIAGRSGDNNRTYVKYKGHEFWLHPVKKKVIDGKTDEFEGQISHMKSFEKDDQRYFTMRFSNNGCPLENYSKVSDVKGNLRGQIISALEPLISVAVSVFASPAAGAAVNLGIEMSKEIKKLTVRNWEDARDVIFAEVMKHIACSYLPAPVTVYTKQVYGGTFQHLPEGNYTKLSDQYIGNDTIVSMKIADGYRVIAYEHANYKGDSITIDRSITGFRKGTLWRNGIISSLKIERKPVEVIPSVQPPVEQSPAIKLDEIAYDPAKLTIVNEGANGWLLTDGRSRMKMFDNETDARNGMHVARRHNRQGFVGRDNPRPDRQEYILQYWTGESGLSKEALTKTDRVAYNPSNLSIVDMGEKGWSVRDGNHWMFIAHDKNDAQAIVNIAKQFKYLCFIGQDNKRPDRRTYIMTYFEK